MYYDNDPCEVCGSPVQLQAAEPDAAPVDAPVGGGDGETGAADATVDDRVCTNPECPTHQA